MTHSITTQWNTYGHNGIKSYFENIILSKTLGHAYVFAGHTHVGKDKIAYDLGKMILCFNQEQFAQQVVPCNNCEHCRQYNNNIHPDLIEINQEYDKKNKRFKKNISVEQIRELNKKVNTSAFLDSYKVIIIHNAHLLSIAAANSLLKTLEEPPQKTCFILLTDHFDSMPATILSRSILFHLQPLSLLEVKNYKPDYIGSTFSHEEIAQLSYGYTNLYDKLTNNNEFLDTYITYVNFCINLLKSPLFKRFDIIKDITSKKSKSALSQKQLLEMLEVWKSVMRDILLIQNNNIDYIQHTIKKDELSYISKKYTTQTIILFIKNITKVQGMIKNNINSQLALENLFLGIPTIKTN